MKHRIPLMLAIGALAVLATLPAWADTSVAKRLDARGVTYTVDEDGDYKVIYNYSEEGRTQLAFVSGGTEDIAGFRIREVFAPAARLEQDRVDGRRALELLGDSRSQKLGAWEVAGDVLYFVIKLPDSVDGAGLEAALDVVAQVADDKEIELSGDRDEL
ncbi:hypothetical protein [uncultured Luteimonas sp.]|uniref:hypothetical protein n=1 Tax=uncultured Luteimonas sp. TaxID=453144 RepID=UPI002609BEE4|nr:hypothetical protein [uncultured Luteimonas sp.]